MINNTKLGIQYMLISAILFAFMGAFAKGLSQNMSSVEVVFFRNLFGMLIILFSIYRTPLNNRGGKPLMLISRGIFGFISLMMFFYNIKEISLTEAMIFVETGPIFTTIFAFFLLKERLSLKGWIGVVIGFIGILFIVKFEGGSLSKAHLLGILSGVFAGLAYTSIRELRAYYDHRTIVLSLMISGTIGPAICMIIAQFYANPMFDFVLSPFVLPTRDDIVFIVGLGVFSTFAQIYMTKAYAVAKAGIVGTVSYTNIVFSLALGVLLGDAFPDIWSFLGIALIVYGGVMVMKIKS